MDCILIHTPWEAPADIHVERCHVAVINPTPMYLFRSDGRTYIAREPHVRVHCQTNRSRPGYETGYAPLADIRRNPAAAASLIYAQRMRADLEALSPKDRASLIVAFEREKARRGVGLT